MAESPEDQKPQQAPSSQTGVTSSSSSDEQSSTATDEEAAQPVLHVESYPLPDGSTLLRLPDGQAIVLAETLPLALTREDTSVDSVPLAAFSHQQERSATHAPAPAPDDASQQEEDAPAEDHITEPLLSLQGRRPRLARAASRRMTLVLLSLLLLGILSYVSLVPLTASATITITPTVLHRQRHATVVLAVKPAAGQVQGRPLLAGSLTASRTVPATGQAHDDARAATGAIVLYNTDLTPVSLPAGLTFRVNGLLIVTDTAVTIPAAVPPVDSQAATVAHVLQAGSQGNLPAGAIYTHCCQAAVIATNVTPFTGGQDARTYHFIQASDLQAAANELVARLTPQAMVLLQQQLRAGEQLVPPLCRPQTQASAPAGSEAAVVTVSVTQTCSSVAYAFTSLQQVATQTLMQGLTLATYAQVGTTQMTITGSTYTTRGATLTVALSGVWVYQMTTAQQAALIRHIVGTSQQQAKVILKHVVGVAQVSIHLHRLDFSDRLPTDAQHITLQWVYVVG